MWYAVDLLFKSNHQASPAISGLWEEVILLVNAETEAQAKEVGSAIGRSREHEYFSSSPNRHLVKWTFERVDRVFAIDESELSNGTEVFSRFLRESEVLSLSTPFDDNGPN